MCYGNYWSIYIHIPQVSPSTQCHPKYGGGKKLLLIQGTKDWGTLEPPMKKKTENWFLFPKSSLPKRMKGPYPKFPSRHFLKLALLYLLNCLIRPIYSKKKGYWLLKPSPYRWINKAFNGKSSSCLIAIAAFALTSIESDQRHRDPADLLNFPGCVLQGIECVDGCLDIRDYQKHNIKKK